MGSIMSAISDDIDDYLRRCAKYGETVQQSKTSQGISMPDCYGKHSDALETRERNEYQAELKRKNNR